MNNKVNSSFLLKILLVIVIILIFIMAFFAYRVWQYRKPVEELTPRVEIAKEGNQKKPEESKEEDKITISLKDYKVFDLENIDFKFVIAKIKIQSIKPINLQLNHFKTSEGIVLNEVQEYVQKLEEQSFFLGRQNVWFRLISNDLELTSNIFIPIKDRKATSISLLTDFSGQNKIQLDLSKNEGLSEMLYYKADDVISDGATYQMKVSAAYDITGEPMYQVVNGNENEYLLPSTTKVYVFSVEAVSLWGDSVILDSAIYVPENSNEQFTAMDSSIHSMKLSNILGKEITEKDTGYLFFYAYDPDSHPVTYTGILKLKLKNSDRWINVNVNLN